MSEDRNAGPVKHGDAGEDDPNPELEDAEDPETEEEDADAGDDAGQDEDDEPDEPEDGRQGRSQETARQDVDRLRHRGGAGEARRFSQESERRRAAEQRSQQLEQQLNYLLQQQGQKSQAERDREEADRIALMSTAEFAVYVRNQAQQTVQQQVGALRKQIFDESNQSQFRELLARNRVAAAGARAHRDRLEELRRLAPDVPQRVLLATAIGEAAIERGEAALTRGANRAAAANERVRARPASGGRDQPAERRRGGTDRDQRAARLSGQFI